MWYRSDSSVSLLFWDIREDENKIEKLGKKLTAIMNAGKDTVIGKCKECSYKIKWKQMKKIGIPHWNKDWRIISVQGALFVLMINIYKLH